MNDPTEDMLCLQEFDETAAAFYRLKAPNVPWGDYGSILVHGMASHDARDTGSPEVQRTGPFVPPISFPGLDCIVATDHMRRELKSSGLTGFSFVPAIKKVVVPIDWHEWDLHADEPLFTPRKASPRLTSPRRIILQSWRGVCRTSGGLP